MTRLFIYIGLSLAVTAGMAWLFSLPGTVLIDLGTYRMQPSIGTAGIILLGLFALLVVLWSIIRRLLNAPRTIAQRAKQRSQRMGVQALSDGFIALQGGDPAKARILAREAQNRLAGNTAAQLLEARADLSLGQWGAARDQYRALIDNPKTALAALSGLHEQAVAQGRDDAALTFAQKAHSLTPQVAWANKAVFEDLTKNRDWHAALDLVAAQPAQGPTERELKKHKKAMLHAALAFDLEDNDPIDALSNAQTANKLAPDFVPTSLIAARLHSSRGDIRKATSLLRRLWRQTHHPHAATLYAHAQLGISPAERLKRITDLIPSPPPDAQSGVVLAQLAIQAGEWATARNALAKFASNDPTQAVCMAMAEIEEGQSDDQGRARQWLARAVSAPRDPIWTADGITLEEWQPISPVSGRFDSLEWKVPLSQTAIPDAGLHSLVTSQNAPEDDDEPTQIEASSNLADQDSKDS